MNRLAVHNYNHMQYFIELYVGSKKQKLTFLIDTGSSVRNYNLAYEVTIGNMGADR